MTWSCKGRQLDSLSRLGCSFFFGSKLGDQPNHTHFLTGNALLKLLENVSTCRKDVGNKPVLTEELRNALLKAVTSPLAKQFTVTDYSLQLLLYI